VGTGLKRDVAGRSPRQFTCMSERVHFGMGHAGPGCDPTACEDRPGFRLAHNERGNGWVRPDASKSAAGKTFGRGHEPRIGRGFRRHSN